MDFEKLIPFIKKALDSNGVSPEEVMQVMNQNNQNVGDKNTETVDSELIDNNAQQQQDVDNEEGKLLESTFKELEVEEAVDKVQEQKSFEANPSLDSDNENVKFASCWEILKAKYAHNSRTDSSKE